MSVNCSNRSYEVFLCHNSQDKPIVRQLRDVLRARGIRTWFDEDQLVAGQPWQESMEKAIKSTDAVAVCVGNKGIRPWQNEEMRVSIDKFVRRKAPVIPVLLPGASRRPRLPAFLSRFMWVDLRQGLTEDGIRRLISGIRGTALVETPIPCVIVGEPDNQAKADANRLAVEREVPHEEAVRLPPGIPPEAVHKARFVMAKALESVCEQLLQGNARSGSSVSTSILEQRLKECLIEVMVYLRSWLDTQKELQDEYVQVLHEIIVSLGAAGLEPSWVDDLTLRLKTGHGQVPPSTDIVLCEVILRAVFRKPVAGWFRSHWVEQDLLEVEAPSTDLKGQCDALRDILASRHFGQILQRAGGESDEAFEKRRTHFIRTRLPVVLKVNREDGRPLILVYDETDERSKAVFQADPEVWDQVLKMERSKACQGVILVELGDHIRAVFNRLSELSKGQTSGA